jgi:hypothetical protein
VHNYAKPQKHMNKQIKGIMAHLLIDKAKEEQI